MDLVTILFGLSIGFITWGVGLFVHGRKEEKFRNDIRKLQEQGLDLEIRKIRQDTLRKPLSDLLDEDEFVLGDDDTKG